MAVSVLKTLLERSGLALAGILLPLLAFEIALRLAGHGGPAPLDSTFDRRTVHYAPHPSRLHPHTQGRSGLRVAVIGDSFTAGPTAEWDDFYPARLERLLNLNANTMPAQVRTFAEPGATTAGELRFLKKAVRFEPDILILGVFLNDAEVNRDPVLQALKVAMRPRIPIGRTRQLLQSSRAAEWIYQRFELGRVRRARAEYSEYVFDPQYKGWVQFELALATFAETCRSEGIRLVAVVFPVMAGLEAYAEKPHRRIGDALERHGIEVLDLADRFAGRATVRMAAYPEIDAHPSEIAHRISAHAIFEYLLEQGHLPESYRPADAYIRDSAEDWLQRVRHMRSPAFAVPPRSRARGSRPARSDGSATRRGAASAAPDAAARDSTRAPALAE